MNAIKLHESAIEILEKIQEIDIEIQSIEESIRAVSGYVPFVRIINENEKEIARLKSERKKIIRSYSIVKNEIDRILLEN